MTIEHGNSGSKPGLIGRVMGLALRPKDEWAVIDGEGATVQGLFTGHVMILAAIPAVMGLLASMVMGSMFTGCWACPWACPRRST